MFCRCPPPAARRRQCSRLLRLLPRESLLPRRLLGRVPTRLCLHARTCSSACVACIACIPVNTSILRHVAWHNVERAALVRTLSVLLLFYCFDMSSIQSSIQDLESFKKVDTARALGIRQELDMYSQTALRLQPAQPEPLYGRDVIQGVPQPTKEVTSLNRDIFDKDIKSKEVRDDMESVAKMAEQTKNIREISKEEGSGEAENAFIESIFGKGGLQILQESKKYAHDGNYTKTREMLQQFIHKYEKITNPDGVDIMQKCEEKNSRGRSICRR